jgi:arabinofuranosyltransferase
VGAGHCPLGVLGGANILETGHGPPALVNAETVPLKPETVVSRAKSLSIAIPTATFLAYLTTGVILDAGLVDDSYIFLRYADNLASGHGLVFNIGNRVEGFTSPLWAVCLGIVGFLNLDLVLACEVLGIFFGLAILVLFFLGWSHLSSQHGALVLCALMLFLATNPSYVYWSWSGMDTACFTFLLTASFLAFLQQVEGTGTMVRSGTWFSLAAVARLDMLSVLPVYLLFILYSNRHRKRLLWRKYVSFLGPLMSLPLLFLWRYHYYGALLPNTYYAKAGVAVGVLLESGLVYAARFALAYNLHLLGPLFLGALVLLRPSRRLRAQWAFTLAIMGMWTMCVVWVGGDHLAMFRFFVPILPLLAFLMASMIDRIAQSSDLRNRRTMLGASVLLTVALCGLNYSVYVFHEGKRATGEVRLARSWAQVGQWFRDNAPSDATMASAVVGAIPYYSGLTTYDLLGLTDSEVARHGDVYPQGRIGHQKYHTDYILARKPLYIVYHASGLYDRPLWRRSQDIDRVYSYALYDLANDERTKELYEYQAVRMDSGAYVEFLKLKGEDP